MATTTVDEVDPSPVDPDSESSEGPADPSEVDAEFDASVDPVDDSGGEPAVDDPEQTRQRWWDRRSQKSKPESAHEPDPDAGPETNTPPKPRPPTTAEQVRYGIETIAAFLEESDRRRASGAPTRDARPTRDVLETFGHSPRDQTLVQAVAAAATARHLEGATSANAARWERLVEQSATGVLVQRQAEIHADWVACEKAGVPQEVAEQRSRQRWAVFAAEDQRVIRAAAAVSLHYTAARALPSFDKVAALANMHVGRPNAEATPEVETATDLDSIATAESDSAPQKPESEKEKPERTSRSVKSDVLSDLGSRMIRSVGSEAGGDVAPNLSPINLMHVADDLLTALRSAKMGHPRSVRAMLGATPPPGAHDLGEFGYAPNPGVDRSQQEHTADL